MIPPCRHRLPGRSEHWHVCASPLIYSPTEVPSDFCARCPYANHADTPIVHGEPPPFLKQAVSFFETIGRHVMSGLDRASDEEYARRRAICDRCPHHEPVSDRCNLCGCWLEGAIFNKLRIGVASCPDKRW